MPDDRKRVLLLEDDALQTTLFMSVAGEFLDDIVHFEDVELALEGLRASPVDLCVIDLGVFISSGNYSAEGGLSFISRVREEISKSVPIIIATAVTDPAALIPAFEAGADDYVMKTEGISQLIDRMKVWLGRAFYTPDQLDLKRRTIKELLEKLQDDNLVMI
ncbi:MAG: response regulator [Proteobacteria bacterium]|nr:response regulator [Pseudomonadota bacterium]